MKRFLCLALALSATLLASAGAAAEPGKIRVLLTYGGHAFDEPEFFALFDNLKDVTYTKAELPKQADLLKPGLEKDCDVIVRYDMTQGFTPEQEQNFQSLMEKGIGLVALHHNLGAQFERDQYRKIIGGKFLLKNSTIDGQAYNITPWKHDEDLHVTPTAAGREHPITRGIEPFDIHDETYGKFYVAPGVTVLLETDHPRNNPQLAWTREYGPSRVFFLMLGHDKAAYANPAFVKLIDQGIRWAAGK